MKIINLKQMLCLLVFASGGATILPSAQTLSHVLSQPAVQQKTVYSQKISPCLIARSVWGSIASSARSFSRWSLQDQLLSAAGVATALYIGALCTVWFLKSWGFKYDAIFPWRFDSPSRSPQKKQEIKQPKIKRKIIEIKLPVVKEPLFLKNDGNTCYIDSIVTVLLTNTNFCKAIEGIDDVLLDGTILDDPSKDSNKTPKNKCDNIKCKAFDADVNSLKNGFIFLKALKKLIQSHKNADGKTASLLKKVQQAARAWFENSYGQQDAQELWNKIQQTFHFLGLNLHISTLQKGHSTDSKKIKEWSPETQSMPYELLPMIRISLLSSSGRVIKESVLQDRILPEEKLSTQNNFLRFVSAPQVLVFGFDRFKQIKNNAPEKITSSSSTILLPEQLDLAELGDRCADECKKTGKTKYALSSVVCHSGTLTSGHYVTYVKQGDEWYLMDDMASSQEAQEVSDNKKKKLFAGTPSAGDPVLVFYDQQP